MKKILMSCIIAVSLLGVGTGSVQASKIKTYPLINTDKIITHKHYNHNHHKSMSRAQLKNCVYVLSIQLGANRHSMRILDNGILKHGSYKKLMNLYRTLTNADYRINHIKFNAKYWGNLSRKQINSHKA